MLAYSLTAKRFHQHSLSQPAGGLLNAPLVTPANYTYHTIITIITSHPPYAVQELGMTLEGVPEVAQVSTAQMGLRMLRAKALGMPQRDVLLLLYRVPVVFLWDDECAHLTP